MFDADGWDRACRDYARSLQPAVRRRRLSRLWAAIRAAAAPAAILIVIAAPLAVAQSGDDGGSDEPTARAAATGSVLREGVRNPSRGDARRETELIGDIAANAGGSGPGKGGYVLRESNLSRTGGGPVHGCRAVKGNIDQAGFRAGDRNTKPCIRVSNLSNGANGGRAFEFAFGGPLGGLIEHDTGGDQIAPFATNATGVAPGLNADRLDGHHASDFVLKSETGGGADGGNADTLDGKDSTDFLGKTEKAADADKLDGFEPSSLVRAAFAQETADALAGAGGEVLTTTIEAPTSGILLITASADVLNYAQDDFVDCIIQVDESDEPASRRTVQLNGAGSVNQEENCTTHVSVTVGAGSHKVDFEGRGLQPGARFDEAALQVLFVPFGADGAQP